MKISFFHDTKLLKSNLNYYSIGFPYRIWKRYLRIFDQLKVSTRSKEVNIEEDQYKGYQVSNGEFVEFDPVSKYWSMQDVLTNYFGVKKEIRNILQETDGAIIRVPSVIGIIAAREAIKMRKKYLVESVGCSWDAHWNYGTFISKMVALPLYLLQKRYTKKADFVIYITKDFLQKRYPTEGKRADGVANVMITPPSNRLMKQREERINNMNDQKNIKIGLIGSLNVAYKGHNTAIKALSKLKEHGVGADLYFVGGGDPAKWSRLAKSLNVNNNVHFVGTLKSGDEIFSWLEEMDFYIQPSTAEGHGRALVEAVSMGCISFGSNVGGISDTLETEYLFPPHNADRLAKLILKAINDPHYSLENIYSNIENILMFEESIITKKRDTILNEFKNSLNNKEN